MSVIRCCEGCGRDTSHPMWLCDRCRPRGAGSYWDIYVGIGGRDDRHQKRKTRVRDERPEEVA